MTGTPARLSASVALCSCNGAMFLREQIESISTQTRLPDEIVVRDDRSDDDTVRLLQDLAQRSPIPIRIAVNEERMGSTTNFLAAIADCRRNVVFLSDQDDVWLPHKMATMMDVFEAEPEVGLVISDATVVDRDLHPLGYTVLDSLPLARPARARINRGAGTHLALKQPFGTGSSMAMRGALKSPLLELKRPDALIHDSWLLMVADAYSSVRIVDEPLNLYRQHAGQQVGAPPKWRSSAAASADRRNDHASHRRQLAVYEELRASLVRNGRFTPRAAFAGSLDSAIAHATQRLELPAGRVKRVPAILREWASGRYGRFSSGWKSVGKDLLLR